jgi:molybdenum-dependent DNA-binding transcriptional regulator ModE
MNSNTFDNDKEEGEILNINYHKKRLILKALNNSKTIKEAAKSLGARPRYVVRLIKEYNFKLDKVNLFYYELVK